MDMGTWRLEVPPGPEFGSESAPTSVRTATETMQEEGGKTEPMSCASYVGLTSAPGVRVR